VKRVVLSLVVLVLEGCAATVPPAETSPSRDTTSTAPPRRGEHQVELAPAAPTVDLVDPQVALVRGGRVGFDGLAEGLAWPALHKALAADSSAPARPWVLQATREVPIQTVLRAAWVMREGDVQLQAQDDKGAMRAVRLRAKGVGSAAEGARSACHVAVFVRPDGSVHLASRAGPRDMTVDALLATLRAENETCPLRFVGFGAESRDMAWGKIFDVILAVDRAGAAGEARYVLGEAIRAGGQ
jgi:hypothetical protein